MHKLDEVKKRLQHLKQSLSRHDTAFDRVPATGKLHEEIERVEELLASGALSKDADGQSTSWSRKQ